MTFHDPWYLLLLIPFLVALPAVVRKERDEPGLRFPSSLLTEDLPVTFRIKAAMALPVVRIVAALLMVVALARPQAVRTMPPPQGEGIDIMLAVDVSTSMLAMDLDGDGKGENRMTVARRVIREFIGRRPADRIGVVAFAARPYLLSPLTRNHEWLSENLDRVAAGMVEDGTALGDGLVAALKRLRVTGGAGASAGKIVILLTDGRNNAGKISPPVAAEAARALGIKVYTIGIGSRGRAVYPVTDPFGRTVMRQVNAEIDEQTLQEIARTTGAAAFRATDAAALGEVYRRIDLLERHPLEGAQRRIRQELFPWFLAPALLILLADLVLRGTVLRRVA